MSVSGVVPEPKDALRERLARAIEAAHRTSQIAGHDLSAYVRHETDAVLVELAAYLNEHRDEAVKAAACSEVKELGAWGYESRGLVGYPAARTALYAAFGVVFA